MNVMDKINKEQCTNQHPEFNVGDTLKVFVRIVEGGNERLQAFTGVVIARKGGAIQESFTLRRVISGQGVERVFPINSPRLAKIEVVRKGEVRRAKLYYLRDKIGKAAKIKDKKD
ncbi:MAG: 50S ribosomal protein L19 [Victivallaceae bacterium]|nr:50S ribosomal protein L19 [Victivallaceae bacterium]NLK83699.1 50S ribosomal protein L19 [Lentisphaerota bacterium]MDD3115999.1 50S ribosomal protein L19 [Victivallaceae bacterium]MDD3703839.1 50S ribosomal protein L19 [Victivallaceae bacterium]MDD4318174.1 50S ribosomal protein L19 [Victivallaceae bacterium]